jgi:hypothetical protein
LQYPMLPDVDCDMCEKGSCDTLCTSAIAIMDSEIVVSHFVRLGDEKAPERALAMGRVQGRKVLKRKKKVSNRPFRTKPWKFPRDNPRHKRLWFATTQNLTTPVIKIRAFEAQK